MFKFTGTKLGPIVSNELIGNPMSSKDRFKGVDDTTGCGTADHEFHNFRIPGKVVNDNQVLSFV